LVPPSRRHIAFRFLEKTAEGRIAFVTTVPTVDGARSSSGCAIRWLIYGGRVSSKVRIPLSVV
jgi:hypothetical protein